MTVVSNLQFWLYTASLLILWIIVVTTAFNNDIKIRNQISLPPKNIEDELEKSGICKSLCNECGCLNFYCGEECICECNDDHPDTECIRQIQVNAQKLNIPFEVLIQGPTGNNFVRKALQFEQNRQRKLYGFRNKRSTVTVYKPGKESQNEHVQVGDIVEVRNNYKNRLKRSTSNHFDWFNDVSNNLLRPAPLSGQKHKNEKIKAQMVEPKAATKAPIFDNSWFFDNTGNILTPRPLNICRRHKLLGNVNNENNVDSSTSSHFDEKFNNDIAAAVKADPSFGDEKINFKNSFSVEHAQKDHKEIQENLITTLYSRLFKNDFNRNGDKYSFLPQAETLDYLTGNQHYPSFNIDLSETESEKDLFSDGGEKDKANLQKSLDDREKSRSLNDDVTTTELSSPSNIKKELHELPKFSWFKPGKFFEKLKAVIKS